VTAEVGDRVERFETIIENMSHVAHLSWMLEIICEALVSRLGYRMVWIGLIDKYTYEVKPVVQKGFEEGYLSSIKVRYDDTALGRGPTGTAIRTAKPVVQRDIAGDPSYTPWREQALKRGYKTSAAIPLKTGDMVIGALNVYSDSTDAFGEDEVRMLEYCAGTISVAIENASENTACQALETHERLDQLVSEKLLMASQVYVSRENLEEVLQLFKNHLDGGWNGLYITRQSDREALKGEWLRHVPTFRLTGEAGSENAVWGYSDLTILISSFVRVTEKPFVLVDGLEELERCPERGFLGSFIEDIHRQVSDTNAIMVVRMDSIKEKWSEVLRNHCIFL